MMLEASYWLLDIKINKKAIPDDDSQRRAGDRPLRANPLQRSNNGEALS